MKRLPRGLLAYAAVGLPLAAGALPLYIHVASVYVESFGAALAAVGGALLLTRAADALLDPLIGMAIDRLRRPRTMIVAGVCGMAAGLVLVFHPPAQGTATLLWLVLALIPAYLGYSVAAVGHLALGSTFGATSSERAQVAIWREGFSLLGVLIAATTPQVLSKDSAAALADSSLLFAAVAPLAVAALLVMVPNAPNEGTRAPTDILAAWRTFARPPFRGLLTSFAVNGVANALPSVLVLFFVADVIGAPQQSAFFLVAYFAAGAAGLPAWLVLARRRGTQSAWRTSMLLGAAGFVGAALLGPGDTWPFLVICVATGLTLGADLALPAALLTDGLREKRLDARVASHFGVWTFTTKMTVAAAAGLGLPLVGALGYLPGQTETAASLQAVYCLVPCGLKLAAASVLSLAGHSQTQGALP